jgi:hypothetical protein
MEKGKTNNPNGRPIGKPNKITTDLKAFIADIVDMNREAIINDLEALEPYQRLIILEKLLRFVVPQEKGLQSIEVKPEKISPVIIFGDDDN